MKNTQKNSSTKLPQQKLEAPVVLTPDQIAVVAAGTSLATAVGGHSIVCGGMPAGPIVNVKSSTQI